MCKYSNAAFNQMVCKRTHVQKEHTKIVLVILHSLRRQIIEFHLNSKSISMENHLPPQKKVPIPALNTTASVCVLPQ